MNFENIGELALRDYKKVKYFPFGNDAGAPFILTADPLNYLEAWINAEYSSIIKDKSNNRPKLEKAKYFTRLAKDFYKSSKEAEMPSKGTLIYYSFLNLVKVFLIMNGLDLETQIEHHGISLKANSDLDLKLASGGNGGIFIFQEFAKLLGKEIDTRSGVELNFLKILRSLPEVHEIGYALNIFPDTKRKFLPVEIDIRTDLTRKKIYYTLAYEKKFDKIMKTHKLEKNSCKELLSPIEATLDNQKKYFISTFRTSYTHSSDTSWKICYPKLVNNINQLNINTMITRRGYRLYLDLEPSHLHRLSSTLAFAYYIGTVARYRPSLNEKVLKGKYQAIINEAVISCPNQFFYCLVSKITKQVCAIPMAKVD